MVKIVNGKIVEETKREHAERHIKTLTKLLKDHPNHHLAKNWEAYRKEYKQSIN